MDTGDERPEPGLVSTGPTGLIADMSRQPSLDRETLAERRIARRAMVTICVIMLANYLVNSSSIMMEADRAGRDIQALQPWFIEGVSMAVILALLPLLVFWERRHPVVTGDWRRALPFHILGALVFSLVHVVTMGVVRETLHPLLFGVPYDFFSNPLEVFVYELRKDVVTYSVQVLAVSGFRLLEWGRMEVEAARAEARETSRVTLKCGGRVMRLPAGEFRAAKAAGNYVEARFGEGRHLARLTLRELEALLREAGVDAVRVHRSWLVNRDQIKEIIPTGEGDVTLTLSDGESVPGSRRYRDRLAA